MADNEVNEFLRRIRLPQCIPIFAQANITKLKEIEIMEEATLLAFGISPLHIKKIQNGLKSRDGLALSPRAASPAPVLSPSEAAAQTSQLLSSLSNPFESADDDDEILAMLEKTVPKYQGPEAPSSPKTPHSSSESAVIHQSGEGESSETSSSQGGSKPITRQTSKPLPNPKPLPKAPTAVRPSGVKALPTPKALDPNHHAALYTQPGSREVSPISTPETSEDIRPVTLNSPLTQTVTPYIPLGYAPPPEDPKSSVSNSYIFRTTSTPTTSASPTKTPTYGSLPQRPSLRNVHSSANLSPTSSYSSTKTSGSHPNITISGSPASPNSKGGSPTGSHDLSSSGRLTSQSSSSGGSPTTSLSAPNSGLRRRTTDEEVPIIPVTEVYASRSLSANPQMRPPRKGSDQPPPAEVRPDEKPAKLGGVNSDRVWFEYIKIPYPSAARLPPYPPKNGRLMAAAIDLNALTIKYKPGKPFSLSQQKFQMGEAPKSVKDSSFSKSRFGSSSNTSDDARAKQTSSVPKENSVPILKSLTSPRTNFEPNSPKGNAPMREGSKHQVFRVVAIQDYKSSTEGHLTFRAGDVIVVTEKFPTGWWRGECNGISGTFPADHVSKDNLPAPNTHLQTNPTPGVAQSHANHHANSHHHPQSQSHLHTNPNATPPRGSTAQPQSHALANVLKTNSASPRVRSGRYVPATSQTQGTTIETKEMPLPALPAIPALEQCRALYDNRADDDTELNFKTGDIITIEAKDDSGWWLGTLNGIRGFFPANRVEVIKK